MIEKINDPERQLTVFNCSGELTRTELYNAIISFLKETPTQYELWDFTNARFPTVSKEDLRDSAFLGRKYGSNKRGGKNAIVAPENLEYGLSRMFKMMAEIVEVPFEVRVFRSLDEATLWLFEKNHNK